MVEEEEEEAEAHHWSADHSRYSLSRPFVDPVWAEEAVVGDICCYLPLLLATTYVDRAVVALVELFCGDLEVKEGEMHWVYCSAVVLLLEVASCLRLLLLVAS